VRMLSNMQNELAGSDEGRGVEGHAFHGELVGALHPASKAQHGIESGRPSSESAPGWRLALDEANLHIMAANDSVRRGARLVQR
jgi:hypothetical protein